MLVLGLGNPEPAYAGTRHNLGFWVVRELAGRQGISLGRKGMASLWGEGFIAGRKVLLALPQTYMNRSGMAARQLGDYFKLTAEQMVAVHDDLDLELGRLKITVGGGSGGHKGVASLIQSLGSEGFTRLRLGLGRPRHGEDIERYVLEGFYADQHESVGRAVLAAAECLEVILDQGPLAAMQKFHRAAKEEVEG